MKAFFEKLGFRKMDEMEQHIAFRAQRNAYLFLLLALLIWTLSEGVKGVLSHTELHPLPFILLVTASAIQNISQLVMARNAVKDDADSCETTPLLNLIVWVCLAVGLAGLIAAVVTTMGVPA